MEILQFCGQMDILHFLRTARNSPVFADRWKFSSFCGQREILQFLRTDGNSPAFADRWKSSSCGQMELLQISRTDGTPPDIGGYCGRMEMPQFLRCDGSPAFRDATAFPLFGFRHNITVLHSLWPPLAERCRHRR